MTLREWEKLKLPMEWCIFRSFRDGNIDESLLDLRAGAPDGVYPVTDDHGPRVAGVTVEDGLFVPVPTALACYEASARGYVAKLQTALGNAPPTDADIRKRVHINHCCIEMLRFDTRAGIFHLQAGS